MLETIPFNHACIPDSGVAYFHEALASGNHAGDGPFSARCSELLAREIGSPKVLMTPSCTAALEMCALLLDLKEGDEVIFPAFTFVSTVNAFILRGAKPVFCDSREEDANIDAARMEGLITPRTRAIVVVHYAGVACEMDRITEICERHGIPLVEDLAHGPFATWKGQNLGTFGTFATLSFHHTKNFSCGEGGAILINDPVFFERAEILREKGTNRALFLRGQVDKYTWVDKGASYLLSDLLAALLLGGLEERVRIQGQRIAIWNRYYEGLEPFRGRVGLPILNPQACGSAHIFHLVFRTLAERQDFINFMKARGIQCPFHYQSLDASPMGLKYGGQADPCVISRALTDRLVRLPLWDGLPGDQVTRVVSAAKEFLRG